MTGLSEINTPSNDPRLIAFYLPQFHPIKENDEWWGKGFTEWTNVTKSTALFPEHYQPHLPTDLGFYDLRVKETRHDQIKLAKEYGIDGFCYHYYWFSGNRLLEKPLDDMLSDPDSDMPFCLCWANENWTRRWDGDEHEILMAQQYLPDDDKSFVLSLLPFVNDERYIRIDGKPLLIVYRAQLLPDAKHSAKIWRETFRELGVGEVHLCAALTFGNEDYDQFGFDSGIEFPPHNLSARNISHEIEFNDPFHGAVFDYAEVAESYIEKDYKDKRVYKTVFPSWDNTARKNSNSLVVANGIPKNYEFWLSSVLDQAKEKPDAHHQMVFINAWNEWAEGCHLEPDRRHGSAFLQSTLDVKNGKRNYNNFSAIGLPTEDSPPSPSFFSDLTVVFKRHSNKGIHHVKQFVHTHRWLYKLLYPFVGLVRKFK
jgi:lipopolysaccharide biosynthesis protein